jgi:hypothetical protein
MRRQSFATVLVGNSCDAFIKSIELVAMGETVFPPAFLSFALDIKSDYGRKATLPDENERAFFVTTEDTVAPRLSPREKSILGCLVYFHRPTRVVSANRATLTASNPSTDRVLYWLSAIQIRFDWAESFLNEVSLIFRASRIGSSGLSASLNFTTALCRCSYVALQRGQVPPELTSRCQTMGNCRIPAFSLFAGLSQPHFCTRGIACSSC